MRNIAKYGIAGSTRYQDIPESTTCERPGSTTYEEIRGTETPDARYNEVSDTAKCDIKRKREMPGNTRH